MHYSLRVVFFCAVALAFASVTPAPLNAQPPHSFPSFMHQVGARVHALVNELRVQHGLRPLEREAKLDETVEYFAGYIAREASLDHRADGSTPAARVQARGYVYCVISENIAFEYSSRGFTVERLARNLVDGWLDSQTHRENMLDPAVTQTGLGVARSAKGEYYAVQLFARPALPGAGRRRACPR